MNIPPIWITHGCKVLNTWSSIQVMYPKRFCLHTLTHSSFCHLCFEQRLDFCILCTILSSLMSNFVNFIKRYGFKKKFYPCSLSLNMLITRLNHFIISSLMFRIWLTTHSIIITSVSQRWIVVLHTQGCTQK